MQDDGIIIFFLDPGRLKVTHQAQERAPNVGIQPLVHREHDVICRERIPGGKGDSPAQIQRPGQQIVAGRPALQQNGYRDIICLVGVMNR